MGGAGVARSVSYDDGQGRAQGLTCLRVVSPERTRRPIWSYQLPAARQLLTSTGLAGRVSLPRQASSRRIDTELY